MKYSSYFLSKFFFLTVILPCLLNSCVNKGPEKEPGVPVDSPAKDLVYSEIMAPVFVGHPPSDAYIGLSKMEDGEIRHYDYGEQSQLEVEEIREEMRHARKYIYSRDNGLTWYQKKVPPGFIGADVRSPISGEYLRILVSYDSIIAVRSEGGINGKWIKHLIEIDTFHMFAPPVFIGDGGRILVTCHKLYPIHSAGVYYSDDDGLNWKFSEVGKTPPHVPTGAHKGPRWQNPGIEPTIVEKRDGKLWMIIRCSQDVHYQSFSEDGGESWSTPEPSRFYGTITMPRIGRLSDGRLLFIWNNTTPLPELSPENPVKSVLSKTSKDGTWEDVFTNRAALHAAVSDDEGKTWSGFRELYLDPRRNASDYTESGGVDHSVHQSQFVELDEGKVLVSFGQHPLHRSMVVFDPDWLYETSRTEDFSGELENWCTHKFIAEIKGHCSFNRKTGASLVDHPDTPGKKVLQVKRPEDPSLLIENDGAVWNFPSGEKGTLTTRVLLPKGSQGTRINLTDRWFNPIDTNAYNYAMFTVELVAIPQSGTGPSQTTGILLEPDAWHTLRFEWNGLGDTGSDQCELYINEATEPFQILLNRKSINGISYVHYISTATKEDPYGILVESVDAKLDN
ncbi:sialidase family protein [Bacteroidota bacterium]